MDNEKTKVCTECGRELPLSAFNRNENSKSGVYSICRECMHRRWTRKEWASHNMALEKIEWPFDDDCHEMDMEAIAEYKKEKLLVQ